MGSDQSTQVKGAANNAKFTSFSNFSPGYIKKLKERFELASDDFTLDKDALKTYFKCSDRECNILFEHFDMDGNGKIDSYEFICAMTMLSHSTLEEKAELIFGLYDFDGSKYISRDELVILMTNALTALKSIQKLPAPSIQDIEKKTDDFFRSADTDNDKKITLKEFKAYISKDKQILEVLLNANVARKEDLGMDFGGGGSIAPDVDPDLENECNPKDLVKTEKKQNIKDGIDVKIAKNDNGEFFEEAGVGDGDQFMAVKPWLGVVNNSVPTAYKPSKRDGEAPDASLQLEHVYGYRCHDARNNLRYNRQGNLVYHAAGVGIVHDSKTNKQKFFFEHNDDIHCLALDPTGQYAATGQIGPKPWLCVWDTETMQCVVRLQGVLLKGIKCVEFSNDGKYLAASAFDDDHTIAIYDWKTKPQKPGEVHKPIASGKGTRANILSLGFNTTGTELVATCVKEVNFYTFTGGLLKGKKGTGWSTKVAQEGILCQAFIDNTLYTGAFSGSIIQWQGSAIAGVIKAHTEGCQAMFARKNQPGIITGGGDGMIIIWTLTAGKLTQQNSFDLKLPEIKSMMPKARSVCEGPDGSLLVGTRGGEILEYKPQKPKPDIHMRAHYEGELWGLACHPVNDEFVTIGQDMMLAIWDIKTRKQRQFGKLDCAGNVLAFTKDASKLAIGYTNGTLQVLQMDSSFSQFALRKDRKEAISEIKFSPDDSICAVGAHDSCIFTYDARNNFRPLKKLRGHPSTVSHFDFSQDSRVLMSNCTSYNILFFDVQVGKHNPSGASSFKNEPWATWTCTLGWPVQGIFPPCADGSDINAVDRSPDGGVLATADDFGMVKLFRYPCPVDRACFQKYIGHSSHVTNVRFAKKSQYLISTGGEDKCIFQWKYNLDQQSAQESNLNKNVKVDVSNIQDDFTDNDDMFVEAGVGEGDQKLAVEPFKGEVLNSVPSGFKLQRDAGDKPNGNLKLKYAHGFRSFDTRGNLKYKSQNEVVFTTAALGIVLNKQQNTQRFFNLHEEDVVSMAIHPSKDIIATGQMAAKGKAKMIDIFIWKASTMECLAQLNKFHLRAVRNLQFSPSGDKLVSVGEDDFHSVAVWDWANKRMLANAKVDPDRVFDVCWKDECEFATVGMKHVKFFTLNGASLTSTKGTYGQGGPQATICCNYILGDKKFVAGTPQGNLLVFNGKSVGQALKKHTDALWSIVNIKNGSQFLTGGNDAKINVYDAQLNVLKTIDLAPMSKFQAGVRSMDYLEQGSLLLVGTRGAEIIELNLDTGAKLKTLINGHFEGTKQAELWGCAVHPKQQKFASCGADKTIRIWTENKQEMVSDEFEIDLTAMDWSKTGTFMVVGDRSGFIHTVDANTLQKLASYQSSLANKQNEKAWVEDVKISPNCQFIAFGTHGGLSKVELVSVGNDGRTLTKYAQVNVAISSALTHLDWSLDSSAVVINSQAYELMWVNVNSKSRITASGAKDMEWATWTCLFGFPVQGIWPGVDFTDVNSVCRSNSRQILASADDFGKVKLFKYPCVVERAQHNSYMGHSSHVTKVKFSANDKYVITTGGNDKTVIVWETDFAMDDPNSQMQQEEEKEQTIDYGDDEAFFESKVDRAKIAKAEAKRQEMEKQKLATSKKAALDDDFFDAQDVGIGTEFAAVKPWVGQIREPTGYTKPRVNQSQPPTVKMEIDWVHGYRSRDSRNNIGLLIDGSIAYHAAALGIVYNPQEHSQRYFNMHTDDVTAIAFSPDKRLVATGEIGPKPIICIWDAITMTLVHKLQGKLFKGIQALAFSPTGKTLAGVAIDDDHSVAVYNVETGALLGTEKGDKAWIIDIAFKNDTTFATSGVKHFKEWQVGSTLTSKRGQFGQKDMRHGVCKYMGETCLSASITGELYVWTGTTISKTVKLHDKPMDCIHVSGTQYVLTGGKDNKVCILAYNTLQLLHSFSIDEAKWGSCCGKVRALYLNNNQLFVGTLGSEIFEVQVNIQAKTIDQPRLLVNGHYSPSAKDNNEVWGLSIVPNRDIYVSVSDDATMRIWDTKAHKQLKCVPLNIDHLGNVMPVDPTTQELSNSTKGRCCDVSSNGQYCAVGFKDGTFRIYQANEWNMVAKKKVNDKIIQDLKFSPNSKLLAVASHDFAIYIYVLPKLELKAKCKASTAGVTHIDWSLDSQSLHSNDLSYELLYFRAEQGTQDKSGASNFRDEHWATWTCPIGWPTQGIWPAYEDGSDINAVDRSNKPHPDGYHLLATANDSSLVKMFRYPSADDRAEFLEGRGHSSHVTNVKFGKNDQYLFSTGGNDTCVIQWKITQ